MQNEKQRKVIKVHEKLKILRKKFDEQTKGTHPRKMSGQSRKYSFRMNNLEGKRSVREKDKGPTKRFSYGLRSPKPQDKKIQKFLPHLIPGGGWKTRGEKKVAKKNSKSDEV